MRLRCSQRLDLPHQLLLRHPSLCVQVCPAKLNLYGDPVTRSCVSACPNPSLADNSTMRCVSTCPTSSNYYANTATLTCVFNCPNGTYADNQTRTCVATCPNDTFALNSTWRCVSYCYNEPLSLRETVNWICAAQCPLWLVAHLKEIDS